jgi:hypothetical protein
VSRFQLPKRHKPGSSWRILAHKPPTYEGLEVVTQPHTHPEPVSVPAKGYIFDELVIDHWFHIEQMDDRVWWMRVGDADITVRVGERGEASSVHIRRGDHGEVKGNTEL